MKATDDNRKTVREDDEDYDDDEVPKMKNVSKIDSILVTLA
jgi:hypothetical protein